MRNVVHAVHTYLPVFAGLYLLLSLAVGLLVALAMIHPKNRIFKLLDACLLAQYFCGAFFLICFWDDLHGFGSNFLILLLIFSLLISPLIWREMVKMYDPNVLCVNPRYLFAMVGTCSAGLVTYMSAMSTWNGLAGLLPEAAETSIVTELLPITLTLLILAFNACFAVVMRTAHDEGQTIAAQRYLLFALVFFCSVDALTSLVGLLESFSGTDVQDLESFKSVFMSLDSLKRISVCILCVLFSTGAYLCTTFYMMAQQERYS